MCAFFASTLHVYFLPLANECFGIMCCFLKSQFSVCCIMTTEFALEQLERKSLTFVHTKSVLAFIKQVKTSFETSENIS